MKRLAVLIIPVLLLLLLPTAALAKTTPARFDKALDKLYQQGYPQALEEYFVSLGTNADLGFRWAGTSAELAAARRTFRELKSAGLRGVKYEAVPADVFEFKHAGVTTASGLDFIASAFAGTPPTGKKGITADVVYVGNGTKAAFDAAEAATGEPVAGKLVLMDLDFGDGLLDEPARRRGRPPRRARRDHDLRRRRLLLVRRRRPRELRRHLSVRLGADGLRLQDRRRRAARRGPGGDGGRGALRGHHGLRHRRQARRRRRHRLQRHRHAARQEPRPGHRPLGAPGRALPRRHG